MEVLGVGVAFLALATLGRLDCVVVESLLAERLADREAGERFLLDLGLCLLNFVGLGITVENRNFLRLRACIRLRPIEFSQSGGQLLNLAHELLNYILLLGL